MTSIVTNTSAMAALQTLRMIGATMTNTQTQVSSGLRVATASDNAAYWSISTTMRSDNRALSAISDALGLGAAKVDIAYSGLEATADILGEFLAKLVAAKEPGVDQAKIQTELEQLKGQLASIASSASFNGVNWLETDNAKNLVELSSLPTSIVSSFVRATDGSVAVGEIDIELADISLFNTGGGGALQKDIRSLGDIGGFRDADANERGYTGDYFDFTGPVTFTASDTISFDILIDDSPLAPGVSYSVTIDKALVDATLPANNGKIEIVYDFGHVLRAALTMNGVPVGITYGENNGYQSFILWSLEQTGLPGSSVAISNVVASFPGNFALGLEDPPTTDRDNIYPEWSFDFTSPFRVYHDTEFSFDVEVNGNATERITIDRDLVDSTFGTTDGIVASASDMATLLSAALAGKGLLVTASGPTISFNIDTTLYPEMGRRAFIRIGNVTDNIGPAPDFDILDVDITDPSNSLDNYLTGVDAMLQKVIDSASTLGAVKTRIDMQSDFTQTLMDTIDKGVGRLVDADMDEASTRLKALQTQEQLAIEALHIANTNAENVMQLFR